MVVSSAMTAMALVALDVGVTAGFALSACLGLYLWVRLRAVGNLELALAHLVANPRRRREFVWTVGISFGAFVAAGALEAVADAFGGDSRADVGTALLLLTGGVALLVLIANSLRPTVLSLEEEWSLAETAARASSQAPGAPPAHP